MDNLRTDSVPAGTGGSASDNAGSDTIPDSINVGTTGAVDPDAARNAATPIDIGDDFAAAIAGAGETTRKTRRPRGPNKTKASGDGQAVPVSINGIEKILYSIHAVLAGITHIPELELEEKEAKEIAKAIAGVSEQYMLTIDPKKAAWIDLARVVGVVYGPRGVSYWLRKKAEASQRVAPATPRTDMGMVFNFDPTKQKPIGG